MENTNIRVWALKTGAYTPHTQRETHHFVILNEMMSLGKMHQ